MENSRQDVGDLMVYLDHCSGCCYMIRDDAQHLKLAGTVQERDFAIIAVVTLEESKCTGWSESTRQDNRLLQEVVIG